MKGTQQEIQKNPDGEKFIPKPWQGGPHKQGSLDMTQKKIEFDANFNLVERTMTRAEVFETAIQNARVQHRSQQFQNTGKSANLIAPTSKKKG